uniref:Ig-like domain-containing protein n=1 Tax=Haplochromis burtoni TaxID=8153 RepID=A0A3Q3C6D3_HAPBU
IYICSYTPTPELFLAVTHPPSAGITYTCLHLICAFKGSSVDISCTYNSYESSIQSKSWFRSGRGSEDLTEDSQYAGRVEVTETERGRSTLRIRDLTESDSAEYHFKFKTQRFEWKSSLPGTTLTVTGTDEYTLMDISFKLKCESSCSPAGRLSFVWFKNNQFMVERRSYQDLFSPGDIISCAFKGHEGYRSDPVYIPKLPSVSVSPSAEIVEGSSVTLTCSSDANPAANYTWYKEQQPISQEKQIIFRSIWFSDSGKYCCTAENELGKTISKVISINIVEGSSVTLTCSSDANLAANYTWYKEQNRSVENSPGRFGVLGNGQFLQPLSPQSCAPAAASLLCLEG